LGDFFVSHWISVENCLFWGKSLDEKDLENKTLFTHLFTFYTVVTKENL